MRTRLLTHPNAHFSFQEYKALIDESLLPERLMATLRACSEFSPRCFPLSASMA
jgi:hypothetical protein